MNRTAARIRKATTHPRGGMVYWAYWVFVSTRAQEMTA